MEYVQMTLDDWVQMKQRLKQELLGVKQSFVRIGYTLRRIEDQKLYEQDGYKSITDFAKEEYGLEASTVSRFISINREYSIDGYSEILRPEYTDLGRSQLEEMLKLPKSDRQMIQPETSREDIRELKRFNKSVPESGVADDLHQLIEKFCQENPEIIRTVLHKRFEESTVSRFAEVVNPGGNRSYRKGIFFLMMYENRVTFKKFGNEPQNMTWWEFYGIAVDVVDRMAADGKIEDKEDKAEERAEPEKDLEVKKERTETADKSAEHHGNPIEKIIEFTGEKETKKEIAPAQKNAEILKEKETESGKNGTPESIQEGIQETPQKPETTEESEVVEIVCETRKEYMDGLTAAEMATYIAEEHKKDNLGLSDLESSERLYRWLTEQVDRCGNMTGERYKAEKGTEEEP